MDLRQLVLEAHRQSAMSNTLNGSNVAARNSAAGSGELTATYIGALSTLGGHHGATRQARYAIYHSTPQELERSIIEGRLIPGWGNSFFKEGIDPAWQRVDEVIHSEYSKHGELMDVITGLLHRLEKRVWPNPAGFTAVAAEILELPEGTEISLLVEARLPVWTAIYADTMKQMKELHGP